MSIWLGVEHQPEMLFNYTEDEIMGFVKTDCFTRVNASIACPEMIEAWRGEVQDVEPHGCKCGWLM